MAKFCRTCAQNIITNDYFNLDGSSFVSSTLHIKDLMESCIPNFDVDLLPNSTICRNCVSALHIAYLFKVEAMQNEDALHRQHKFMDCDASANSIINDASTSTNGACSEFDLKIIENIEISNVEVEVETAEEFIDPSNSSDATNVDSKPVRDKEEENLHPDNSSVQSTNDLTGNKSEINIASYIQFTPSSSRKKRDVKRPHKCNVCGFCSSSKPCLRMHMRIHTGETPFPCTVCSYKAKRKAHLENHMKIHTGERPFKCDYCGKASATKKFHKDHLRTHTGEKPYHCVQCNYRANVRSSVVNHVRRIHLGIPETVTRCLCPTCGKYLTRSALGRHIKRHITEPKLILCDLCGKYFRGEAILKNHMQIHTGEKPFECQKCDYIASRKAHLQDHILAYGNHAELFDCEVCGKRYPTTVLVKKHMKDDHTTKPNFDIFINKTNEKN